MKVEDLQLEVLRKFNAGRNSKSLANDLPPGTYPIEMTVNIAGTLQKGKPSTSNRRNDTGSAHIVRYLLDRINDATYDRMLADIDNIRKGKYEHKEPEEYQRRLDRLMPYRTVPRAGPTSFNGQVIIEDIPEPNTDAVYDQGLKLIGGE
tara:strand:- start:45 stop:491 length:447 start_codon:yes stop_codon:yes gene_type:complete